MAEQISVFLENKPGRLKAVTGVLADAGINVRAVVIQDRRDFGVAKLLADNPRKAHLALTDAGFACALKPIVAVCMDDKPGGMHAVTTLLFDKGININDAYGFVVESRKRAVWCIEVDNVDQTRRAIEGSGFSILSDSELYEL